MQLDPYNRERAYSHTGLGNGEGIPAQDIARMEEAITRIRSHYQIIRIIELLDTCDVAWKDWRTNATSNFDNQEIIAGDINRSVNRLNKDSNWKRYLEVTDALAKELWVANYHQEEALRFRFERGGGERIGLLRGVADTAVGSGQWDISRNHGGFGLPVF